MQSGDKAINYFLRDRFLKPDDLLLHSKLTLAHRKMPPIKDEPQKIVSSLIGTWYQWVPIIWENVVRGTYLTAA